MIRFAIEKAKEAVVAALQNERMKQMSKDELRKQLIDMYSEGKSVDDICAEFDVPKSTFYRWIRKSKGVDPSISDDDIKIIVTKIAELEEEAATYKKVLQLLRRTERKVTVDKFELCG